MTDTYEYSSGPSVFMSGHSDWIIRRVGKPGIIASVVGHEDHAKAAVDALNQAAKHTTQEVRALRQLADMMAAALNYAVHGAHPTYANTAGWRGGIGGQAITMGCSFIDPPPGEEWVQAGLLLDPLRAYHQMTGMDLAEATRALQERYRPELTAHVTVHRDTLTDTPAETPPPTGDTPA